MNRPDAFPQAQVPPSARKNPSTPVIIGIIVALILFLLLIVLTLVIPSSIEKGAEDRSEQMDTAINTAEEQALENANESGTIFQKDPNISMSPELSALDKPFAVEEVKEEQELDS